MRVCLTREKADKIVSACQQLLKKSSMPIKEVAKVIGLLVSSLPGVQYGPLFYRTIDIETNKGNYEAYMTLSHRSRTDLQWWIANLPSAYKKYIIYLHVHRMFE